MRSQVQYRSILSRILFMIYGGVCYIIFLGTFLYAIGFVENMIVPKSIDYGFQGGSTSPWLINILLLSLFAIQHSLMAREGFKRLWTKMIPETIERSTYVLFASVALILLFVFWRPITGIVWNVQNSFLSLLLISLSLFGWFIVLLGTFLINHFNLFGLQQVFRYLKQQEKASLNFVKPFLYKIVRHPIMLGFIIAFWAAPQMTVGHLLFAFATTGYILIAIQLEERDMVSLYGNEYMRYQQEVPQIVPMLPKKETAGEIIQKNF